MKKHSFAVGIISALYLCLVQCLILFLSRYDLPIAVVWMMFYVIPALPAFAIVVFMSKNSFSSYAKAILFYILGSASVSLLLVFSGISYKLFTICAGCDELALGEGLLLAITVFVHYGACAIGAFVTGIVSAYRGFKEKHPQNAS